jgi:hypothetical protein
MKILNFLKYSQFDKIVKSKTLFTNFIKISKFNFSNNYKSNHFNKTNNSKKSNINLQELKEKLTNKGHVKLYDAKYTFNSEKLLAHSSIIFLIVSTSTIFFTQVSIILKIVNLIFLFTPSLLIQIERIVNNTRFIKSVLIIPNNKIQVINMWGRVESIPIEDLNTADFDPRVQEQKKFLNNETFIIFTNKKNRALYHLPREGVFLDEDLLYNTLEGKKIL